MVILNVNDKSINNNHFKKGPSIISTRSNITFNLWYCKTFFLNIVIFDLKINILITVKLSSSDIELCTLKLKKKNWICKNGAFLLKNWSLVTKIQLFENTIFE